MKLRTIAQLKKLISEGLKKSTDGIARLNISEDEFLTCVEGLSKWISSKRWILRFRAAPYALISDPIIEDKPKGSYDYRLAVLDMKGSGWRVPEPFFVSDDCPSEAGARELAGDIQAKYPDAVLLVMPAERKWHPNYYNVRAHSAVDWLRYEYPEFTVAETIHYLTTAADQLQKTANRYLKGSHKRGERNRAVIRAARDVLMSDPKWNTAKKIAQVAELKSRTGFSERSIYNALSSA